MALEQGAGTAVTLGVGEFGEEVAADADRIAALSLVAGYDEVIAGEGCGDGEPGGRRDVRHVGEANHYARASRRNHAQAGLQAEDRKSTRLNSSHVKISYAVFCLKKKKIR